MWLIVCIVLISGVDDQNRIIEMRIEKENIITMCGYSEPISTLSSLLPGATR
jgi:hypothetical protein